MSATKSSLTSEETRIIDREKQCLVQSYGRYSMVVDHGKGCHVCDFTGKSYSDLSRIGVNALGHAHPRILNVMREQMEKLIDELESLLPPLPGPRLAERLVEMSGLQREFFTNRPAPRPSRARSRSQGPRPQEEPRQIRHRRAPWVFSGRTLGSIAVTGQAKYPRAVRTALCPV